MTNVDFTLTRTTAPASALISTADAKAHCRVDHDDDDTFIDGLVSAAQRVLDGPQGMVGKALVTQSWTLTRERLMGRDRLQIPVMPFGSVTTLRYYDADNVEQTANVANDYTVFGNEDYGYIEPVTAWPAMYDRPDALELVFVAGYGGLSAVPANIIHAAKMMVGHWYENREAVVDYSVNNVPIAVHDLVNIDRIGWVKG